MAVHTGRIDGRGNRERAALLRQRLLNSPIVAHVRHVVTRDVLTRWGLLLLGLLLLTWLGGLAFSGQVDPSAAGASSHEGSAIGFLSGLEQTLQILLLLLTLFALRWQLPLVDSRERPFWDDLTAVYLAWLGQVVLYALPLHHGLPFYLVAELLLAAGYIAWILVLERQPHRRQRLRPKDLERTLAWPAATLFVVGLVVYFVLVPMFTHADEYLRFYSSMLSYLTLDLYITLRLLHQVRITASRRWKAIYGILMLASSSMLAVDLLELLSLAGFSSSLGLAPLYGVQWIALMIASRMRHRRTANDEPAEDPATASMAAPSLHTMISAVSLPMIHFAGYRFGWLDRQTLPTRELVVVVWVVLMGCFALLQHWLLVQRARLLWIDWAKADKALRRSEQKARVVTERLRSKKTLQATEERFDIAFQASPTPSALLSVTQGRFHEVNGAFARLVGWRRHQLQDQTPGELRLWWNRRDAVRLRRRIRGRMRVEEFKTHLRNSTGQRVEVSISAEMLEMESTARLLVVVHSRDEQEQVLQVPDLNRAEPAIFAVDHRDRIRTWNETATQQLGWQDSEVLDCYAGEILAPTGNTEDADVLSRQRWRTATGRRVTMQTLNVPLTQMPSDAADHGRLVVGQLKQRKPRRAKETPSSGETSSKQRSGNKA